MKSNSYDSILVIIYYLIKIAYYQLVKPTINVASLVKIIIYILVKYHNLLKIIISNKRFLFTLKFWSLLYHFFDIK